MALKDIETFIIVIMENRSFDHGVGYLSTAHANPPLPVEGLRDDPQWLAARANMNMGKSFPIHLLTPQIQTVDDPPHEHSTIALQIDTPPQPGSALKMGGFVESYVQRKPAPSDPSLVMGFYDKSAVPTFDFFARNFAVCDHWFSALPTGTQPNRLMAMGGESKLVDNAPTLIPDHALVYDWLSSHNVSWCAYQAGEFFPFFSLMGRWLPEILTSLALSEFNARGRFRRYSHFRRQWQSNDALPAVIFVEPQYTDGPRSDPNDDHPPTGIAKGQAFLADIYDVLISNPNRWKNTVMIVFYDEHGGFFDHVPPLDIQTEAAGHLFATTGVRIPGFVVSPHVAAGVPFKGQLDHTSMLQMLADRFNPGATYSAAVGARQPKLARLSDVLITPAPQAGATPHLATEAMTAVRNLASSMPLPPPQSTRAPGAEANARAFENVALKAAREHPDLVSGPGWKALEQFLAAKNPR